MVLKINEERLAARISARTTNATAMAGASSQGSRKKNGSFVCHYSSHLLIHEQSAYDSLLNMNAIIIDRDRSPTDSSVVPGTSSADTGTSINDIQKPISAAAIIEEVEKLRDSHDISTIIIECPHREIGGKCTPLDEILRLVVLMYGFQHLIV